MIRDQYLNDPYVIGFKEYLSNLINGNEFNHQYDIANGNTRWINYNRDEVTWRVSTLQEAYAKYYWPSGTNESNASGSFDENIGELDSLSKTIIDSVKGNQNTNSTALDFLIHGIWSNLKGDKLLRFRTSDSVLALYNEAKNDDDGLNNCLLVEIGEFLDLHFANHTLNGLIKLKELPARINKREKLLFASCLNILEWGGVLNKSSIEWLFDKYKRGKLGHCIQLASDLLTSVDDEDVQYYFSKEKNMTNQVFKEHKDNLSGSQQHRYLLMNAGMTKVYSLYCGESVIYDGRVGAALGLLVSRYLASANRSDDPVPETLRFPWGADRKTGVERNPSTETHIFPKLGSSGMHALWNLRANWILSDSLNNRDELWGVKNDAGGKNELQKRMLRAVEAAVFMIGYKVR